MITLFFVVTALSASCNAVDGDRITMRDLAQLEPALAGAPPEQIVSFAPVQGSVRVFQKPELRRLAARSGVEWEPSRSLCFVRKLRVPASSEILSALLKAVGREDAKIELLDHSGHGVPEGEISFGAEGPIVAAEQDPSKSVLWRGRIQNAIVWARVRMSVQQRRIVAVRDLKAGTILESDMLRAEERDVFPFPRTTDHEPEQVLGRRLARPVRSEEVIYPNWARSVPDVFRGETVQVEARTGSATVIVEALAEGTGRSGEAVMLKNVRSGKRFRAVVDGRKQAHVEVGH